MTGKTHWRKFFDSPYLSSADIVEPITVTVDHARGEKDKARGKEELVTVYFKEKEIRPGEKLKPMVCNVTNSKTMTKLAGSPYLDFWAGTRVQIYVDHAVKFGRDMVEGLRMSEPPALITDEQVATMRDCMDEVGADPAKFFNYLGITSLEEMPVNKWGQAMKAIEAKRSAK